MTTPMKMKTYLILKVTRESMEVKEKMTSMEMMMK
jgi:hypothetical protein